MQQKMPKQETMTQAHIRKAQGAFLLAHRMGLIEDPSMEGLKARRQKHNEELRRMEQEGQRFYGPHYFSAPAYLQYELTRLKLDFVQPCEKVREGGYLPGFHGAGEAGFLRTEQRSVRTLSWGLFYL